MATGCLGPKAMEVSLIKYSNMYAEASNEQMLLNLARRANGHPAYFMQLGSINSVYSFSANAAGSVSENANTGSILNLWSKSFGLSGSEQPSFSLTPLSGKEFAVAIFDPISSKIFFNLVEQGVGIDKLLRVMAQSVVFTTADGKERTLLNIPDPEAQSQYRDFMRFAGISRELQKRQLLSLNSDETGFIISSDATAFVEGLSREHAYFNFESKGKTAKTSTNTSGSPTISIQLRTFESVLTALANEHTLYNELVRESYKFLESLPPSERRPILRIDWEGYGEALTSPVAVVNFEGHRYTIRDEVGSTWNRDVFILLGHLYTQISLDPASLPVQQLIQVQ